MAARDSYQPGEPCWLDLGTTDVPAAQRFYGELFGWSDAGDLPPEAGGYRMWTLGDKLVAGVMGLSAEQASSQPPSWTIHVAVADLDLTAKKAEAAGGTVALGPMDVMNAGRMAVLGDPTGAAIGCWQPGDHKGAGRYGEPGALSWIELTTGDPDAAARFYRDLFGWSTKPPQGSYTELAIGDTSIGGLQPTPPPMSGHPAVWTAFFLVESCDRSTEKAAARGATTVVPPTDAMGGQVRFSVLRDPQGVSFGVFQ